MLNNLPFTIQQTFDNKIDIVQKLFLPEQDL